MTMSRGATAEPPAGTGAGLQAQLNRLPLDDELGRIVREGLSRLAPNELSQITTELDQALNALKPALQTLHGMPDAGMVCISRHVSVFGEVESGGDLLVEGRVEGSVRLEDDVLVIGPHGSIKGPVTAATIVVHGLIEGRVNASVKIDIRDGGCVIGDVAAPGVAIAEGATFKGAIDMGRSRPSGRRELNIEDLLLKPSQLPFESPTKVR